MADIRNAPLFVLAPQTGGTRAAGATSGSNRPLAEPAYDVFEVV